MSEVQKTALLARITSDPGIFGGKPIIRGMRMRVIDVLEQMANGVTEREILNDFPFLELDDIRACLLFAAQRSGTPLIAA